MSLYKQQSQPPLLVMLDFLKVLHFSFLICELFPAQSSLARALCLIFRGSRFFVAKSIGHQRYKNCLLA